MCYSSMKKVLLRNTEKNKLNSSGVCFSTEHVWVDLGTNYLTCSGCWMLLRIAFILSKFTAVSDIPKARKYQLVQTDSSSLSRFPGFVNLCIFQKEKKCKIKIFTFLFVCGICFCNFLKPFKPNRYFYILYCLS